jgi:hypothetical protein
VHVIDDMAGDTVANVGPGGTTLSKHNERVFVIGVGMTKFEKPGSREDWDYPVMARESGTKALDDAGVSTTRSRRRTSATCTATPPRASGPCTSWD